MPNLTEIPTSGSARTAEPASDRLKQLLSQIVLIRLI